MEKGCLNCNFCRCKALRESPQVSVRVHCSARSLSILRDTFVQLCGWKVGWHNYNSYLLHAYSLDCALGHMGQARPGSFAYRDSMEAQWTQPVTADTSPNLLFFQAAWGRLKSLFLAISAGAGKNKMLPITPTARCLCILRLILYKKHHYYYECIH